MCDTAYHNEALRKARVLERKAQLESMHQQLNAEAGGAAEVRGLSGEQQRKAMQVQRVRHDPNFNYRSSFGRVIHVDPIYDLMQPHK